MAFVASHLRPRIIDIDRMLKSQSVGIDGDFHLAGFALGDDRVAGIAFSGDGFSVLGLMIPGVASIASFGIQVSDIIKI